ncbi:CBS domain-containing protein [Geotalea toluenoxydans]|uniref:CBS domain-containing protein n=1 Tax=Geotalea toluenoxydans TaxID=421624 RepID=UPI000B183757
MERVVYVIGHRNPDTDSVASAIAYAALKVRQGMENVVAAMAGPPNHQTRFVLEKLGIPEPVYLPDVHPKVRDILQRQPITLSPLDSVYESLEKFHRHQVRSLPVLDSQGVPQGVISLLKLSESLLLPCPEQQRLITTTLAALTRTLGGNLIAGTTDDAPLSLKLFVGAMHEESFSERIGGINPEQLLVITGNLRSIQEAAIEKKGPDAGDNGRPPR